MTAGGPAGDGTSQQSSEPPAWGTPAPAGTGAGAFRVLVEQNVGSGGDFRWAVEPAPMLAHPTREAARVAALALCRRLEPRHPFSEQRRRVFRITPDEYLVTVDGLRTAFHFRVSVAEEL